MDQRHQERSDCHGDSYRRLFLYVQSKLNQIDRNFPIETVRPEDEYFETDENTEADQEDGEYKKINPEDIQWPGGADIMKDKDILNIMLIGQDRRPGESRLARY